MDRHHDIYISLGTKADNKLYQQLIGLFMGCKPSPICAVVRVYTFDRRSIYIDVHYISTPYGRYIDDAFTVVSCKEEAKRMYDAISEQIH